jgi:hypothetical protein
VYPASPDQFFEVLHVMSLIDENLSMKASASPVLERMIEHKHLHYNCSLNDLSIFFYSLVMDGGECTHEVG